MKLCQSYAGTLPAESGKATVVERGGGVCCLMKPGCKIEGERRPMRPGCRIEGERCPMRSGCRIEGERCPMRPGCRIEGERCPMRPVVG